MNSLDEELGEDEVEVLVVEFGEEEVVEGESRVTTSSSLQQTLIIYFQLILLC